MVAILFDKVIECFRNDHVINLTIWLDFNNTYRTSFLAVTPLYE